MTGVVEHVLLRPWTGTPWPYQLIGGLWFAWLGLDLITPRRVRNRPASDGYASLVYPGEDRVGFGRWCVLGGCALFVAGMVRGAGLS